MEQIFVDRVAELNTLQSLLESDKFELIILYGRRRVGKTALLKQAVRKYSFVYYLAIEENNLNRFAEVCEQTNPLFHQYKRDYEVLFGVLKDIVHVVIIDEFQNLIKENPAIISLFQSIVDNTLQKSKLKLILLGSSISIIQSTVLEYKSPLYGRRTASFQLKPMLFKDIIEFYPNLSFEAYLEIYAFADGIPAYLKEINPPFWPWLENNLKSLKSLFRDEVDFLLRYEFESPSMYRQIIDAIAHGKTKLNEIKQYINVQRTDISPYLQKLIDIGLIFRDVPVTVSEQTRLGRYYIRDNFIKFWFRFIYPSLSAIEGGFFKIELIQSQYPSYLGFIFEDVARQYVKNHPPINFNKIGRWWGPAGEIDIVAFNSEEPDNHQILFGSCKWRDNVNPFEVLNPLYKVSEQVLWKNDTRTVTYILFAKNFSQKCEQYKGRQVICVDIDKMEKDWIKKKS